VGRRHRLAEVAADADAAQGGHRITVHVERRGDPDHREEAVKMLLFIG
jgi:hypothetical protein